MNYELVKIKELLQQNRCNEIIELTSSLLDQPCDEIDRANLFFLRGKAWWRLGDRRRATSDYAEAASIDPQGPAIHALENAKDVENFFNPDLLNP